MVKLCSENNNHDELNVDTASVQIRYTYRRYDHNWAAKYVK